MNDLRFLRLQQSADEVRRAARFRHPQAKSFEKVQEIFEKLYDDLAEINQQELLDQLAGLGYPTAGSYPDFQFALATGVGKRRLMGALAAYLIRSRQSKDLVIMAPRTAILDRLEREVYPDSGDFLFLDPLLVPDANICLRSNVESFRPDVDRPNIFVLSPQTVLGRRIAGVPEFRDSSVLEYMRQVNDLVVFSDEAHHLGDMDSAWGRAVADLAPRMHFGFTATPRAGAIVLHSYSLAECLQEGRFTKTVDILAKKREDGVTDEQWDQQTLDYVLARLETKEAALADARASDPAFPGVRAVALVCARDTGHAENIGRWLREERGLSEAEVHVTHSNKQQTEREIADLVALDRPGNATRVVVHVERLAEGWDVTNVYVVAPLRTMGTYRLAVQTLGRGLRLPAGRRVANEEADTLDVVCFGRATAQEILEQAKTDFRDDESGTATIGVKDADEVENRSLKPKKRVTFRAVRSYTFSIPRIETAADVPDLSFDPEVPDRIARDIVTKIRIGHDIRATSAEEGLTYTLDRVRASTAARLFEQLDFLNEWRDGDEIAGLVERALRQLGVTDDVSGTDLIYVDPLRIAVVLAAQIRRRWRERPPSYHVIDGDRGVVVNDARVLIDEDIEGPIAPTEVVMP
jgi:type III restriction enzyme